MALPDVLDAAAWLTNEETGWLRAWQPVATVDALAQAGGVLAVRLGGKPYVLVDAEGGPAAFADQCPDGHAPLSVGRRTDDVLRCRHGVTYLLSADRLGAPAGGCGTGLAALPVGVRYGLIWLAPLGSVSDVPDIPEWDDPEFTVVPMPVYQWRASAAQMADNFLDVAHFPFTHPGTIGDPDDRVVLPYEVERGPWHFSVEHRHAAKTLTYSMGTQEVSAEQTFGSTMRTLRFVGTAPHHVYLRIRYEDSGTVIVICFFHQAVDGDTTNLYAFQIRNDMGPDGYSVADVVAQQEAVANEDKVLLEQLAVKGIPVRLGDELHVRADRSTVELRRMLADLVALEPATS
jgi:phenylpropionate dioxygenase-like ring-hydroxylating dioxygenase large terminal subunit